jgi:hypothetical protein
MPEEILGGEETKEEVVADPSEEKTLATDDGKETKEEGTLLADETKGAEDNKSEDSKTDDDTGAPEKYEDFNVPEGIELNQEAVAKASEVFKEFNLSQEQAQKLVDIQTDMAKQEAEAQADAWKTMTDKWATESKDDKEFGGAEFDANLATAKKAIETFATDEFKAMLNFTGVGNHPEMIRFFFRVGKEISEDGVFTGGKASGVKDPARVLFPNMPGDK